MENGSFRYSPSKPSDDEVIILMRAGCRRTRKINAWPTKTVYKRLFSIFENSSRSRQRERERDEERSSWRFNITENETRGSTFTRTGADYIVSTKDSNERWKQKKKRNENERWKNSSASNNDYSWILIRRVHLYDYERLSTNGKYGEERENAGNIGTFNFASIPLPWGYIASSELPRESIHWYLVPIGV